MTYPVHNAETILAQLDGRITRLGGNVFIGPLGPSNHGDEYRQVKLDVTRQEWSRVKQAAIKDGWRALNNDSIIYDLPEGYFVIAQAAF